MKISFTAIATVAIALLSAVPALAQDKTAVKSAPNTTRTTSDYSESELAGNQVVKFTGDELPADGPDIYGGLVKAPPGPIRAGLLRPRLNFVPELLKSVENL